jgi:hypothetical protein
VMRQCGRWEEMVGSNEFSCSLPETGKRVAGRRLGYFIMEQVDNRACMGLCRFLTTTVRGHVSLYDSAEAVKEGHDPTCM